MVPVVTAGVLADVLSPGPRARWHNGHEEPEVADVAKTRFDWSALPAGLRKELADDLKIPGDDVARGLATRFGAEPTEDFVKEAWTALRDRWIARDPAVRRSVVSALRERGLGAKSTTGGIAAAEVAYLRSCRNTPGLRAIVLSHLLVLGQPSTDEPAGTEALHEKVKAVLRKTLGLEDVRMDTDGDIPIPSRASLTYVRILKDAPVVRVFSPILWGCGNPADIEGTVNDINRRTNWVKAVWENGAVVLFSDVVGDPLAESQLAAAIQSVVRRADAMGPVLQQKYGGTTAVGPPLPPRQQPSIGGYL